MSGYTRLRTSLKFCLSFPSLKWFLQGRVLTSKNIIKKGTLGFRLHYYRQGWYMTRCVTPPPSRKVGCLNSAKYPAVISLRARLQAPHSVPHTDAVLSCGGTRLQAQHCSQRTTNQTSVILVSFKQNVSLVHWISPRKFQILTSVLISPYPDQGGNKLMFLSEWRKFPSAPCLAGR